MAFSEFTEDIEKIISEMTIEEKNQFSHRKKATDKLITFLKDQQS